ncbi:hypothetical protein QVD17_22032 [Tagetes erecta]|uniref:CCHC-type domain-containing protein n=1 Tax=Tagetes erecta TaxID=13708 RepID=A0AAD8NTF4_TARER|nr:hypothetical protein QVD17_22032 [Tagetes erecta]
MSNLSKLEFPALSISGENYIQWCAHVKRHLKSEGIYDTILEGNKCSEKDKAKADVILHKHIDEMLQFEYSNSDNPSELWKDLKSRFDHQKEVLLPSARDEWNKLRFQDFKKVNEYVSNVFKICSTLKFCGVTLTDDDMIEKTLSTFHASNMFLQTQYRLQKIKKFSELTSFLLVAEKNNDLLMKNHQARPTGSLAIPEANAVDTHDARNYGRKWAQGRGRGRGHFVKTRLNGRNHTFKRYNSYQGVSRGRGRGHSHGQGRGQRTITPSQQNKFKNEAGTSQNNGSSCFRCGSANHWSKACRTPSHLCELYQASLKGKGKEVNHVDNFNDINIELSTSDFINDLET